MPPARQPSSGARRSGRLFGLARPANRARAPRIIVALGKTAAIRLTGNEASLASLRGKVHAYRGIPLVITYHPAYLLRNLPDKAKAWEDLLFARRTLGAQPA